MSRGYWRKYAKIGLIALAALVIIAGTATCAWRLYSYLNPKEIAITGDSATVAVQSNTPAGGSECQPDRLRVAPVGPKDQGQRDRCVKAAEEQRQERDQEIFARRSASATYAGAVYVLDQTRIAAVGGALGLVTMVAAIVAAIFAGLAAYYTKRSADISHEAQRPWIAISCDIEKFVKRATGTTVSAKINFYNMGDMAATQYYASSSIEYFENQKTVRDDLKVVWRKFRDGNPNSFNVLVPGEHDTQEQLSWKTLDFTQAEFIIPRSYCILVIAGAYFKIAGSDKWHATERSFVVMVRSQPGFVHDEWIDGDFPNREFALEDVTNRTLFSGETS